MGNNLPEVDLGSAGTVVYIIAGEDVTCARLDNGDLKCWGRGSSGGLGLGDGNDRGDSLNTMGGNLQAACLPNWAPAERMWRSTYARNTPVPVWKTEMSCAGARTKKITRVKRSCSI
eukprot:885684_1